MSDRHDVFDDDEIEPVIEKLREEFLADRREEALKSWIGDYYRRKYGPSLIRPNYEHGDDE